jgi:hypothetical protein
MIDALLGLSFNLHAQKGTYALLLGSGISRSAGIPTGWEMTLDLVVRLAHMQKHDCRLDPAGWYLETVKKEPDYSELLAEIAPTSAAQQQLLKSAFEPNERELEEGKKVPTPAHRAIARLVQLGYVRVIVTTNFDRLLEVALQAQGIAPVVVASPDAAKGAPPLAHSPCTIVKVHGDYLDSRLKNSTDALSRYDKAIDRLLDQVFDEYGLIVSGWSADYDIALRAAMERCKARRYPTYWTTLSKPTGAAQRLIDLRGAHMISTLGADAFFTSLLEKVEALEEFDRPHPITTQAAIVVLKRYLSESKYHIALHDTFLAQAIGVNETVNATFAEYAKGVPSKEAVPKLMQKLEASSEILVHMFATASFYTNAKQARPAFDAFHKLVAAPVPSNGYQAWLSLYKYPALLAVYAAGITAMAAENYAVLQLMASRPSVRLRHREDGLPAPVEIYTHSILERDHARQLLPGYERRHTPVSDYLFEQLRPIVAPFVASDAEYEAIIRCI